MIENLIVLPPQVRPHVLIKSISKYEDQLSVAYSTVVRLNKLIMVKSMFPSER
jgi:DNA-directed RNA polymerase beta' subunit